MELKIIDYHKGDTGKTLKVTTLNQLKKFAEKNAYNAVWIDFKRSILWVTIYHRFAQR